MLNRLRLNTLLLFHVLQPDLLIPTLETSTRVFSNATNRYRIPQNVVIKPIAKRSGITSRPIIFNLYIYIYISSVPYIYSLLLTIH